MRATIFFVLLLLVFVAIANADTSLDNQAEQQQQQSMVYAPYTNTNITNHIQPLNPGYLQPNGGYHFPRDKFSGNIWNPKMFIFGKRIFTRDELVAQATGGQYKILPEIGKHGPPVEEIAIYVMENLPPGKYDKKWGNITGITEDKFPTPGLIAFCAIKAMDNGANVILIVRAGGDRIFSAKTIGASGSSAGSFFVDSAKEFLGAFGAVAGFSQLESEHKDEGWIQFIPLFYQPCVSFKNYNQSQRIKAAECNLIKKNPVFADSLELFGCK